MSSHSANSEPWTVARLLQWTRAHFEKHQLESARLCAEILLAHAMGCRRLELYTRYDAVPEEHALAQFRTWVKEAAGGKPIAYLTGTREFFSLSFLVTPDVLIPRPETEVLVERVVSLFRATPSTGVRILDIGTGSGCIAISVAKHLPDAQLFASDVSEAALSVARKNAERNGVADRIEFRCGDLFAPWEDAPAFDAILSNPPYIGTDQAATLAANVREHEPHAALFAGHDGLSVHRRLAREALPRLKPGGHYLAEMGFDQSAAVRALFRDDAWCELTTYKDDLRHERVVHARAGATR